MRCGKMWSNPAIDIFVSPEILIQFGDNCADGSDFGTPPLATRQGARRGASSGVGMSRTIFFLHFPCKWWRNEPPPRPERHYFYVSLKAVEIDSRHRNPSETRSLFYRGVEGVALRVRGVWRRCGRGEGEARDVKIQLISWSKARNGPCILWWAPGRVLRGRVVCLP